LEVTNSEGPETRGFKEEGFEATKSFDSGTRHGIVLLEPGSTLTWVNAELGSWSVSPATGLKGAGVWIGGKKSGSVAVTFPRVAGVTNIGVEKVPAPGLPEFDEEPEIAEAWQPIAVNAGGTIRGKLRFGAAIRRRGRSSGSRGRPAPDLGSNDLPIPAVPPKA